jgi:WD40 repeat protein
MTCRTYPPHNTFAITLIIAVVGSMFDASSVSAQKPRSTGKPIRPGLPEELGIQVVVKQDNQTVYYAGGMLQFGAVNGKAQRVISLEQLDGSYSSNVRCSPDGAFFVVCGGDQANLYGFGDGRLLRNHQTKDWICSHSIQSNGRSIVYTTKSTVELFSSASTERGLLLSIDCSRATISPDGMTLVCSTSNGTVQFIDTKSGETTWRKPVFDRDPSKGLEGTSCIEFGGKGQRLVICRKDGNVATIDVAKREILSVRSFADTVRCLSISPDEKMAAIGTFDNMIQLVDIDTLKPVAQSNDLGSLPSSISFFPNTKSLAVGLWNGKCVFLSKDDLKVVGSCFITIP